jgi:hypothetical protein
MMRILEAYGIPPKLLRAIERIYTKTKARVILPDRETQMFDITASNTWAPLCFIIVLDLAMWQVTLGRVEELDFKMHPRKSCRHPKVVLTDLDFAGDISLLSDEIEQALKLLSCVEREDKMPVY